MANIVGKTKSGDLIVELGGRTFEMNRMSDVQFGDFIRVIMGFNPLSIDESRGRRNNCSVKRTPEKEEEKTLHVFVAKELSFHTEDKEVLVNGVLKMMSVKVFSK